MSRRVEQVMGLPLSLALRGREARGPAADAAWAEVLTTLDEADRTFSVYRADSVVSAIRGGELPLDEAPAAVHEVLELAHRAECASDGAFSAWLPGPDGSPVLDLTGVVKGWAAERAAGALRVLEDTDFCLSAGGDMVCVSGSGEPWMVGIEDPHDHRRLIAIVPVRDGALATSGSAHRGAHVVDARTGAPPDAVVQVTVTAPSLTWADVDATAAYALGPRAAAWLGQRAGRGGLVVWADGGTTTVSPA